jgi:Uma2 family endonuclease
MLPKMDRGADMAHDTLAPWAETVARGGRVMTADELLALRKDEWQYELVEGRLIRMTPTGLEHHDIWAKLYRALDRFVEDNHSGLMISADTGFKLPLSGKTDTVLAPDIAFVNAENAHRLPAPGTPERKKFLPLAPDLAVEIASPDERRPEMSEKARLYLEAGTRLVWVIWPSAQQVDVWQAGSDAPTASLGVKGVLEGRDVLPGFAYSVTDLFA